MFYLQAVLSRNIINLFSSLEAESCQNWETIQQRRRSHTRLTKGQFHKVLLLLPDLSKSHGREDSHRRTDLLCLHHLVVPHHLTELHRPVFSHLLILLFSNNFICEFDFTVPSKLSTNISKELEVEVEFQHQGRQPYYTERILSVSLLLDVCLVGFTKMCL